MERTILVVVPTCFWTLRQILCTEKNLLCEPVAVNMSALQYALCRVRKQNRMSERVALNSIFTVWRTELFIALSPSICYPQGRSIRPKQFGYALFMRVFIMLTTVTCMYGLTQCSHIYINYTWMHCMHLFIYLNRKIYW